MADFLRAKHARVDFRVPADIKERFQEAAICETGGDLSAFLIAAGLERAERVLGIRQVVQIDEVTRERFYAAMREPARPSDTLRRLMSEDDSRFRLVE